MQVELKTLQQEVGITFVFVTHDQEEALSMSDCIAVMRDGRIVQEGSPTTLYHQPTDRYVAGFIGQSNFIAGEVIETGAWTTLRTAQGLTLRAPQPPSAQPLARGDKAVLAVRPERLQLGPETAQSNYRGRIVQTTFLGDQTEYHLETAQFGRMLARMSSGSQLFAPGDTVEVQWAPEVGLALADD
jgi:ABC-type Fe3+/spermidine/putrescine transport system ATPase subunit